MDAIPKEILNELRETYKYFEIKKEDDGNPKDTQQKSEGLPISSLGTALRAIGLNPSEAELKEVRDANDTDGGGTMKFATFVLIAFGMQMKKKEDSQQEIRDAFKVYARPPQQHQFGEWGGNNGSIALPPSSPVGGAGSRTGSPYLLPVADPQNPFNAMASNNSIVINNNNNNINNQLANASMVGSRPSSPPSSPFPLRLTMSVEDLKAALQGPGEPFSDNELDALLRELDLMPGDEVSIDDILRIVAIDGVDKHVATAEGQQSGGASRRRARQMGLGGQAQSYSIGGWGGGGGGASQYGGGGGEGMTVGIPTNRPSRNPSVSAFGAEERGEGGGGGVGGDAGSNAYHGGSDSGGSVAAALRSGTPAHAAGEGGGGGGGAPTTAVSERGGSQGGQSTNAGVEVPPSS